MKTAIEALLANPRTTAVAILAILGAVHNPEAIDADKIEIILLAVGLVFAKDASASKPHE